MAKSTKKSRQIYLDHAASVSANPSSIHSFGVEAKKKLEGARKQVADLLGARPEEIIFTSGGTESNNLALQGMALGFRSTLKMPHIVTTNIEHSSVLDTLKMLEERKLAQVSVVPVEKSGIVDPKKIKKAIKNNTILVSVMYVNNEIGTIQPIREIAKEIRHYNKENRKTFAFPVFFHTDAVQAVNFLDINVARLGVDLLSLSGSKIEDSGRVGVLYRKKNVPLAPILYGGDQEFGLRPGTENVSGVVEFASALKVTEDIKTKEMERLTKLRDYFFSKISDRFVINGDLENRLPNNINITIPNIPSDLLVLELSARGIMASGKSACKARDTKASHVLLAINKNLKNTDGSLRFSLCRNTTKADIDYTIKTLNEILTKLGKWYN